MKHAMTRWGCGHGWWALGALAGILSSSYGGHYLTKQWQTQLMRQQELTQQTAVHQQVLQEQQRLTHTVAQLQAQLAAVWQQYQPQTPARMDEIWYVTELLAAAQTSKLRVLHYDPVQHELQLSGNFAQLRQFLTVTQQLASPFYGIKLLITKTPSALHITYRYAMHTLAG